MDTYKILVIDDEYDESRKETYMSFFEEEYIPNNFRFEIIPIQDKQEFNNLCSEWIHVDAIFLDAKLDGTWKNHYNYLGVLQRIETFYASHQAPPVFMVSKKWKEDDSLLMDVSMNLSQLTKFEHPSAYYDFSSIVSIVEDANQYKDDFDREKAKHNLQSLIEHRNFIRDEIEKRHAMERVDAIIQLAVPDEKNATYDVFNIHDEDKTLNDGTPYHICTFEGKRVAFITQKSMGPSEASRTLERAIKTFEPRVIIMGGVCAGDKSSLTLGSIIVPKQIWDYTSGKISTDDKGETIFKQRLECESAHPSMTSFYQEIQDNNNMRTCIVEIQNYLKGVSIPEEEKTKKIEVNPMASGPWVVDSETVFGLIKRSIPNDKFCAIDMEAFSVARVSNINNIPWIIIKTVQDYANGDKEKDEQVARNYAAYSSAIFIKMHLKRIIELAER